MTATATLPAELQDEVMHVLSELALAGYIQLVIDYPGKLDERRMGTAMQRLVEAEPILGCRFVVEDGHPFWRRRDDPEQFAVCPLTVSDHVEADTAAWLSERFDPRDAPNIRAALIRPAHGGGDRLLLKLSHVAADGAATLDAAAILVNLYNQLGQDPEYRLAANAAGRDSFLWLRTLKRRERWALLWRDLRGIPRAFGKARGLRAASEESFLADIATVEPVYRTLRFDEQRFAAIKQCSQDLGASLNDIYLAAFFRAFDEFCPSPADAGLAIAVPSNLRGYILPKHRPALCNQTGGFTARIGADVGKRFEDTLNKVLEETKRYKKRFGTTEGQMLFLWLARMPYLRKKNLIRQQYLRALTQPTPPALTNLGYVNARRYACDGEAPTDIACFGEAAPAPVFFSSVIQMDNRLCFGVCYDRRLGAARMEAFMKRLDRHLPGASLCHEALPS